MKESNNENCKLLSCSQCNGGWHFSLYHILSDWWSLHCGFDLMLVLLCKRAAGLLRVFQCSWWRIQVSCCKGVVRSWRTPCDLCCGTTCRTTQSVEHCLAWNFPLPEEILLCEVSLWTIKDGWAVSISSASGKIGLLKAACRCTAYLWAFSHSALAGWISGQLGGSSFPCHNLAQEELASLCQRAPESAHDEPASRPFYAGPGAHSQTPQWSLTR